MGRVVNQFSGQRKLKSASSGGDIISLHTQNFPGHENYVSMRLVTIEKYWIVFIVIAESFPANAIPGPYARYGGALTMFHAVGGHRTRMMTVGRRRNVIN